MDVSLDTDITIHLYDAGKEELIYKYFDKCYIHEFVLEREIKNKSTTVYNKIIKEIEAGKIIKVTQRYLIEIEMKKQFEDKVYELQTLFDFGETNAVALASVLGIAALVTDDTTTTDIFGSEVHRYTLAHGIEDGNVLGFDPYKVTLHDDYDMRHEVALAKAKAKTDAEVMKDPKKQKIFYKYMDSSQIKMYGEQIGDRETGKWVPGIEDFIPNEQYREESYQQGIISDIKKKLDGLQ